MRMYVLTCLPVCSALAILLLIAPLIDGASGKRLKTCCTATPGWSDEFFIDSAKPVHIRGMGGLWLVACGKRDFKVDDDAIAKVVYHLEAFIAYRTILKCFIISGDGVNNIHRWTAIFSCGNNGKCTFIITLSSNILRAFKYLTCI